MPIVLIPAPYRGPTRGEAEIGVSAATVRECIDAVEAKYPGIRELVIDGAGAVQPFVKLFINEEQLDSATALDTSVEETDRVEVLAAIAGGR